MDSCRLYTHRNTWNTHCDTTHIRLWHAQITAERDHRRCYVCDVQRQRHIAKRVLHTKKIPVQFFRTSNLIWVVISYLYPLLKTGLAKMLILWFCVICKAPGLVKLFFLLDSARSIAEVVMCLTVHTLDTSALVAYRVATVKVILLFRPTIHILALTIWRQVHWVLVPSLYIVYDSL